MTSPKSVFVFDLDDTLYPEQDYLLSGVAAVLACIQDNYGVVSSLTPELLIQRYPKNWLEQICHETGLNAAAQESLLWVYRLHRPNISLENNVACLIKQLQKESPVAILTDGRSITQRRKLKALSLEGLPVYISEEYDSPKPETIRFEKIMLDFPSQRYFYIADNPAKDFLGPNSLNRWVTVGIRRKLSMIHHADLQKLNPKYNPHFWVDQLIELNALI